MTGTGLWRDIRIGVRVARAEVIDLWRRNDTRRQRVIYALLAVFLLPTGVIFIEQSYTVGVATRGGVEYPVVATARNLLLPGLLVFAVLGGLGAAQSLSRDSVRPLLLTSASTRAIVVGKLLYLLGTWLVPLVLTFVPILAYAVGARSPLFPIAVVAFGIPALFVTLLIGLTLAYVLWLGIERLGLPEAARRLVTAGISLVIFVVAFAGGFLSGRVTGQGLDQLPTDDPPTLFGWYADLFFLGSPMAEPPGVRTVAACLLVLLAIPLIFAVQVRIAPAFWYAAPNRRGDPEDSSTPDDSTPAFETPPSAEIGKTSGLTARFRTVRVAQGYVRTAIRRPDQYVYLFYYVFPVLGLLLPLALETPELLAPAAGGALIVLGIWLAGAVFCLNPLGTEGAMLSQLVLAEAPAHTFVHARFLAGVVLGSFLSVTGLTLYAITGPFVTPLSVLVAAVLVVGIVVASAGFALGIGSALPKFETTEVFDSVETLAPSVVAALIHGALMLVFTLTGVVSVAAVSLPESTLTPGQKGALLAVFGIALIVTADGSRRYAIARLGDYGRDRSRVDRPFAVYAGVVLSALALILGQMVGIAIAVLVGLDRPNLVILPILFVFEYLGYLLVALGFLYVTRRGLSYLDISWPTLRQGGFVVGGLLVSLVIWGTGSALISGLGLPVADHALFSAEDADPRVLIALVPLLLFVNGPVEELLYRNVIQKYLQELFSPNVAIVIASAIFALAHVPAYLTAGPAAIAVTLGLLFAVSCFWGLVYVETGSLVVVSAIHGLYNALLVTLAYLFVVGV